MTYEKLKHLVGVREKEESGRDYLALSQRQETHRSKINCLLGNAPELVTEETLETCWELMQQDAETALEALKTELEKA